MSLQVFVLSLGSRVVAYSLLGGVSAKSIILEKKELKLSCTICWFLQNSAFVLLFISRVAWRSVTEELVTQKDIFISYSSFCILGRLKETGRRAFNILSFILAFTFGKR